ncbi:MAG: sel1 repeat family protein [Alphaproteobacteria bacterium]|nr:MAG: sel1 repeat family protein [Alphaproteobacteria bacterium]
MMHYSRNFMMAVAVSALCFATLAPGKAAAQEVISTCLKDKEYLGKLEANASTGDVEAIIELADEHRLGLCYQLNVPKGESLLKRAADLGSMDAIYLLAQSFFSDRNGTRARIANRKDKSRDLYLHLGNNGYAPAQFDLGMFYLRGLNGFPRQSSVSLQWFEKAAQNGHMRAARQAAIMRLRGHDTVKADPLIGEQWLRGAAQGGDLVATKLLAEYLLEQDANKYLAEVIQLYEYLAKKGLHAVGVELGTLYRDFNQPETAYFWYKVADASGERTADAAARKMEYRMEHQKIQGIMARVNKFVEENPSLNRLYNEDMR